MLHFFFLFFSLAPTKSKSISHRQKRGEGRRGEGGKREGRKGTGGMDENGRGQIFKRREKRNEGAEYGGGGNG